ADARERTRTGKVPRHRNDQVASMQRFEELKVTLAGEISALLATGIVLEDELAQCWIIRLRRAPDAGEAERQSIRNECIMKARNRSEIFGAQRDAALLCFFPNNRLCATPAGRRWSARVDQC